MIASNLDGTAPTKTPPKMFETRSQAWQEAGLLEQVSPRRGRARAL